MMISPEEIFICPRRVESPSIPGLPSHDKWIKYGTDRCCSFCGSMHPQDFYDFLVKCLETKDLNFRLSTTTKNYKFYVKRPNVNNEYKGAMKFYMHHAPLDQTNQAKYHPAFIAILKRSIEDSCDKEDKLYGEPE